MMELDDLLRNLLDATRLYPGDTLALSPRDGRLLEQHGVPVTWTTSPDLTESNETEDQ